MCSKILGLFGSDVFYFVKSLIIVFPRLNKLVEAPAVVREMDWINQHWPDNDEDRFVT